MSWYQPKNYPSTGIYPQYNTHLRYFTASLPADHKPTPTKKRKKGPPPSKEGVIGKRFRPSNSNSPTKSEVSKPQLKPKRRLSPPPKKKGTIKVKDEDSKTTKRKKKASTTKNNFL